MNVLFILICLLNYVWNSLFDSDYEIIEAPENINPDPLNFEVKMVRREGYKYIDKIKNIEK